MPNMQILKMTVVKEFHSDWSFQIRTLLLLLKYTEHEIIPQYILYTFNAVLFSLVHQKPGTQKTSSAHTTSRFQEASYGGMFL